MAETEKLRAEIEEYEEQLAKAEDQIKSLRKELKERGFDLEVVDNLVRKKLIEKGYTSEQLKAGFEETVNAMNLMGGIVL